MLRVAVRGTPVSQGSKTVILGADGRGRLIEGKGAHPRRLAEWREVVRQEAFLAARAASWAMPEDGPVVVRLHFALPPPRSASGRRRAWAVGARSGDLDKLARACLDALCGVAFRDDAQVVAAVLTKDWAATANEAGLVAAVERPTEGWCRPAVDDVLGVPAMLETMAPDDARQREGGGGPRDEAAGAQADWEAAVRLGLALPPRRLAAMAARAAARLEQLRRRSGGGEVEEPPE